VIKFKGKILQNPGGGAFIEFPFNVEELFGVKGRVPARAKFDGIPYRGSLAKMGPGLHMIGILKHIREQIGKQKDDMVEVEIELDAEPRVVEVPEEFRKILDKSKAAEEFFDSLSYSHKKEYVNYITEAKQEETQIRRAQKALEMLENKQELKS